MSQDVSPLETARLSYAPRVPPLLADGAGHVAFREGPATGAAGHADEIRARFPRTYGRGILELGPGVAEGRGPVHVGVALCGGQAPGGHNVIAGLHDGLLAARPGSRLTGFLGGPRGILSGRYRELTAQDLAPYRNTGGFDLIGSGRHKIETASDFAACRGSCERLGLNGLVIVGGDDSNTNAALLAEFFVSQGVGVTVVGVPKTIDGDIKGRGIEVSFGFDTATKIYSELVGNVCRDAKSAAKYWHFIKLMGRSASHVTLECALATQVNVALIGEEVRERGLTLDQVVGQVADVVRRRAAAGKSYGVCLVPEGLVEFIPELGRLIDALNRVLAEHASDPSVLSGAAERGSFVGGKLAAGDRRVFAALPGGIRSQLLEDRDAHGNVQVSRIDTEQLLILKVAEQIEGWRQAGEFRGTFSAQGHFFGYEGRSAPPSNFDADYSYSLGRLAAILVASSKTGYLCAVGNLARPARFWTAAGIPLTSLMHMETRKGLSAPVIAKALVRLDGAPFRAFAERRDDWAIGDRYRYPGPIQYCGPSTVSRGVNETLRLEREKI